MTHGEDKTGGKQIRLIMFLITLKLLWHIIQHLTPVPPQSIAFVISSRAYKEHTVHLPLCNGDCSGGRQQLTIPQGKMPSYPPPVQPSVNSLTGKGEQIFPVLQLCLQWGNVIPNGGKDTVPAPFWARAPRRRPSGLTLNLWENHCKGIWAGHGKKKLREATVNSRWKMVRLDTGTE